MYMCEFQSKTNCCALLTQSYTEGISWDPNGQLQCIILAYTYTCTCIGIHLQYTVCLTSRNCQMDHSDTRLSVEYMQVPIVCGPY